MRIKNMNSKTLTIYFYLPDWDPREDVISPGDTSDEWLHLEKEDIPKIRETEERNRN